MCCLLFNIHLLVLLSFLLLPYWFLGCLDRAAPPPLLWTLSLFMGPGTIRKAQNLLKQYSQHGLDGKKGGSNLTPLEGKASRSSLLSLFSVCSYFNHTEKKKANQKISESQRSLKIKRSYGLCFSKTALFDLRLRYTWRHVSIVGKPVNSVNI